jgi:hypothetical protein
MNDNMGVLLGHLDFLPNFKLRSVSGKKNLFGRRGRDGKGREGGKSRLGLEEVGGGSRETELGSGWKPFDQAGREELQVGFVRTATRGVITGNRPGAGPVATGRGDATTDLAASVLHMAGRAGPVKGRTWLRIRQGQEGFRGPKKDEEDH